MIWSHSNNNKMCTRWVMKMFINWVQFCAQANCKQTYTIVVTYVQQTFSDLKQVILDQVGQNGYQTVPFSVYIHNLMLFSI